MKSLLIGLCLAALPIYGLVTFCAWDYNPAHWSAILRIVFLFLTTWVGYLLFGLFVKQAVDKRKEELDRIEAERYPQERGGFESLLQNQLKKAEESRKNQSN
jgi:hypothetical protein